MSVRLKALAPGHRITDAKGERAVVFYERRGLVRLTEGRWPCRMVLDLKPLLEGR